MEEKESPPGGLGDRKAALSCFQRPLCLPSDALSAAAAPLQLSNPTSVPGFPREDISTPASPRVSGQLF